MTFPCPPDPAVCVETGEVYARVVRDGLPVDSVYDVAVDGDGWVWVASPAGLFRYDGRAARRWGPAEPKGEDGPFGVGRVVAVRGRRALALEDGGRLAWLGNGDRSPVVGPDGAPLLDVLAAALTADDTLFVAWKDALWRRDATDGSWRDCALGAAPERVWASSEGGAWVGTASAIERVDAAGAVTGRAALEHPNAVAEGRPGEAWVVGFDGQVASWSDGALVAGPKLPVGRVTGAVVRGDTLWVSTATEIVGVRGRELHVLGPEGPLSGGMAIALDREGSLWIGHHDGLYHVPSPDTRIWTDREGLPERGGRAIGLAAGNVWVTSWHEPVVIQPDGSVRKTAYTGASTEACTDRAGRTWLGGQHAGEPVASVFRIDDEGAPPVRLPASVRTVVDLAADASGGLWIGTDDGLYHLADGGSSASRVTGPGALVGQVLEDGHGTVWFSDEEHLCSTPAGALLAGVSTFACDPVRPGTWIGDIEEVDGEIWASTAAGEGLLRHGPGGWTQVPGVRSLPSLRFSWMSPSPRGGVWLAGNSEPVRVRPAPDRPEGWEVLEHLGNAQGMRLRGAGQVLEDPDGSMWVTADGVYHVPAEARAETADPPAPELVAAYVDGEVVADGAVGEAEGARNLVELEYAVPSYREPDRLRFRVRTGPDEPWSAESDTPSFRLVDLPPGRYRFEVEAALEGRAWSAPGAPVEVHVPLPPWLRPWALAVYAAAAASLVGSFAWFRRAVRLRLESERARIAMDLHDEVGSGIGSLGILAGLTADDALEPAARRDAASELARIAEDIGLAVQDVVWSLRRDAGSAEALVDHLAVRGRRLFADGRARFHVDVPEGGARGELSLLVRREVQLFAGEALHNAARHAEATNVWLRLHPGRTWVLAVEDDGRGIDAGPSARPGGGNGLAAMRARAARIGARLTIEARSGGGTVVELRFPPHPERRWPRW